MSDEELLGKACGIQRTTYVLVIAILFLSYGLYNLLYYALFVFISATSLTPNHCSGSRCNDLLTCDATKESSYHLRIAVIGIGSVVFGIKGVNAILNKYGSDLFQFAGWCVAAAVVYFAVMCLDGAYLVLCGNHYSYNTVVESLLWPVPDLPVKTGVKYEIRTLDTYPKTYVDTLCLSNAGMLFALWTSVRILVFLHAAYQAALLSERFHYGSAGMGATFSIEGWRKRLEMRNEGQEVAYNTFAMAKSTGMDLGWTEDEYKINRPKGYFYRGMQPGAAARAYDGFADDRRNVLL